MLRTLALAITLALLRTSAASAGTGDDGPKDPTTATWLSLGATAAGYAGTAVAIALVPNRPSPGYVFGTAGLGTLAFLGPSLGHLYAGNPGTTGLYVRVGAAAVALVGVFVIADECADDDPCRSHPVGNGVEIAAAALLVAGTVADIATAGSAARDYNQHAHALQARLVPTMTRSSFGLALAGRF